MATYKLIQDIEAEDKILGPLTLRQFVFALIAVFFFYLCFFVITKGVVFMLVLFLPPALFFGFFALPLGRDQPTEVWALAKLRFFFKSRKRIWNQSGVKELVTITVPKRVERHLTKGFSQVEVDSRLKALADTIDSRGWAVKHIELNTYAPPMYVPPASDRLLDPSTLPQVVPDNDIVAADDMLDVQNSPIAQQFQSMIEESAQVHRQAVVDEMNNPEPAQKPAPANNYWFMNNASQATPIQMAPQAATLDPAEEAKLASKLKSERVNHPAPYSNLRTVKPISKSSEASPATPPPPPMTAPADPAILSLSGRDDLNVDTLAREAKRAKGQDDGSDGEVVVSLH